MPKSDATFQPNTAVDRGEDAERQGAEHSTADRTGNLVQFSAASNALQKEAPVMFVRA